MSTIRKSGPEHEKLYQALCATMTAQAANMPADEILAVVSNLVGKLIAMQDQRKYTTHAIMELVMVNIESGNKHVIDELINAPTTGMN